MTPRRRRQTGLGHGIPCAGCGDGFTVHDVDDDGPGGACTLPGCPCLGFRWLDEDEDEPAGYPRGRRGGRSSAR